MLIVRGEDCLNERKHFETLFSFYFWIGNKFFWHCIYY